MQKIDNSQKIFFIFYGFWVKIAVTIDKLSQKRYTIVKRWQKGNDYGKKRDYIACASLKN